MEIDFSVILGYIKKLLLLIFEKFDVISEFEAIDIDIVAVLDELTAVGEKTQP